MECLFLRETHNSLMWTHRTKDVHFIIRSKNNTFRKPKTPNHLSVDVPENLNFKTFLTDFYF